MRHSRPLPPIKSVTFLYKISYTSSSAQRFLKELIQKILFQIHSIQVDGGAEFRGEFEKACQELDIPLIVLPPKKPTYNGGVERGNRTFREEFLPFRGSQLTR